MITQLVERIRMRLGWQDSENGQALIEYSLIMVLVVCVILVTLIVLGNQVKNTYCNITGNQGPPADDRPLPHRHALEDGGLTLDPGVASDVDRAPRHRLAALATLPTDGVKVGIHQQARTEDGVFVHDDRAG